MATHRRYHIKQGAAAHWSIVDDEGNQVFADQDFRTTREAIRELRAIALAQGMAAMPETHADGSVTVDFVDHGTLPPTRESYMLTLEMTPEIHNVLEQLGRDTGQSINGVIQSALGMYKLAVDAHKQGKSVGISDGPHHLKQRFF